MDSGGAGGKPKQPISRSARLTLHLFEMLGEFQTLRLVV